MTRLVNRIAITIKTKESNIVNIFKVITPTEPFHTRYLAAALRDSSSEDRDLFKQVWELVAPCEWDAPECPKISTEVDLGEAGSIDIVICSDDQRNHVVGIEVKTREESTTKGQLERYLCGLRTKYWKADIAIAYLTPFNRKRAKKEACAEVAESLPTVREFKQFTESCPSSRARHVSWLDLADISLDENDLWEQHREYVREHISNTSLLSEPRDRTLESFFGEGPTLQFREALRGLAIEAGDSGNDINIELKRDGVDLQTFADNLVKALEILVCGGEGVRRELRRPKRDAFDKRLVFKCSQYSVVHNALFDLADRYDYLWLEGKENYAIRVAHDDHKRSGVSLIRSVGPCTLQMEGRR